jgi:hypothetical protein
MKLATAAMTTTVPIAPSSGFSALEAVARLDESEHQREAQHPDAEHSEQHDKGLLDGPARPMCTAGASVFSQAPSRCHPTRVAFCKAVLGRSLRLTITPVGGAPTCQLG